MKWNRAWLCAAACAAIAAGQELSCDLAGYKPQEGLKAQLRGATLEVAWQGERRDQLRAGFALRGGQPIVQELAVRKNGGGWIVLGQNLTPEFEITAAEQRSVFAP